MATIDTYMELASLASQQSTFEGGSLYDTVAIKSEPGGLWTLHPRFTPGLVQ